uniref:Translation elongation factor EFTu/EF1A C-terminal domain-containing protein n=1 Tax=Globisporangium ultimum (strain ATCC 200006 / CBS 805.95 / DAOM BR144) TaxID=431595 RepID=K3WZW3_GLOUD
MPWYDGPTLLEALQQWRPPRRSVDKPLRMLIDNFYKIRGVGMVITGRVETGVLTPGMTISIAPKGLTAQVVSIEMHHRQLSEAVAGSIVGVNVKGVGAKDLKRGFVISDPQKDPARGTKSFTAEMVVLQHPGQIRPGYVPVLHCHTSQVACNLVAITQKIDRETGKVFEENPEFVVAGDACTVEFRPTNPMAVEVFQQYPTLGRFMVRDLNQIVAVGIVKSVKRVM